MLNALYSASVFAGSLPLYPLFMLGSRGRLRISERYGDWRLTLPDCIWFHGASLGEMNGLLPLMKAVRTGFAQLPILASATSTTGLERAQLGSDHQRLLPLDSTVYLKRALRDIYPRALVFGETELWPGLIGYLSSRGVPMLLVNARISDHTFPRYRLMRPVLGPLLSKLQMVLASDQQSAERFEIMGVPKGKLVVTGNSKYDLVPVLSDQDAIAEFRKSFFENDAPVLVLASLRPGEEQYWFPALQHAREHDLTLNVIVAPRHAEKFQFFADSLASHGLPFVRRSEKQNAALGRSGIVLLDTLGELSRVFAFAQAAFVGATLVEIGGHNPLEPAMYGACPVLGPHTANIRDIAGRLDKAEAVTKVRSTQDIIQFMERLASRDGAIRERGERAKAVWSECCGATARIAGYVKPFIERGVG